LNSASTETIGEAYDNAFEEEFLRLSPEGPAYHEYLQLRNWLDNRIKPGTSVLDCGCGTGRYAEFLMLKGCEVGIIDISGRSLEFCMQNNSNGRRFMFSHRACATQIGFLEDASLDHIMLMGPMYHLSSAEEHCKVLKECRRLLQKEGSLHLIFLNVSSESGLQQEVCHISFGGCNIPQFRCSPSFAMKLLNNSGFTISGILPVFSGKENSSGVYLPQPEQFLISAVKADR
jgi:ubiquinone/menaquinone biosynthesis C-methylase UbiE